MPAEALPLSLHTWKTHFLDDEAHLRLVKQKYDAADRMCIAQVLRNLCSYGLRITPERNQEFGIVHATLYVVAGKMGIAQVLSNLCSNALKFIRLHCMSLLRTTEWNHGSTEKFLLESADAKNTIKPSMLCVTVSQTRCH